MKITDDFIISLALLYICFYVVRMYNCQLLYQSFLITFIPYRHLLYKQNVLDIVFYNFKLPVSFLVRMDIHLVFISDWTKPGMLGNQYNMSSFGRWIKNYMELRNPEKNLHWKPLMSIKKINLFGYENNSWESLLETLIGIWGYFPCECTLRYRLFLTVFEC